jgi:hypothetical protein
LAEIGIETTARLGLLQPIKIWIPVENQSIKVLLTLPGKHGFPTELPECKFGHWLSDLQNDEEA